MLIVIIDNNYYDYDNKRYCDRIKQYQYSYQWVLQIVQEET